MIRCFQAHFGMFTFLFYSIAKTFQFVGMKDSGTDRKKKNTHTDKISAQAVDGNQYD